MIVKTQKIRFSPDRKPMPRRMKLGFEGDNMVERLVFDLPAIAQSQTATLMMGGRYANAVQLAGDGEEYRIDLTAEIVGAEGDIEAYVRIDGADGEVWQSDVISFVTGDVPDVETEIEQRFPTAVETMLQEMAGHRAEMEEQVTRAEAAAERAETTQWLYIGPDEPTDPRVVVWIQTAAGSEGVAFALASDGTVILRGVTLEQMDDGTVRMVGTTYGIADDGTVKIGGA
jgi:hypothetical protein